MPKEIDSGLDVANSGVLRSDWAACAGGDGVSIELVDTLDGLLALLPWWTARANSPLQSPEWMLSWWQAYAAAGTQLSVIVVRQHAEVRGIVPLLRTRVVSVVRSLHWLASGRACSDFQTCIAKPEDQPLVQRAFGEWLFNGGGVGTWDMVELEGIADLDQFAPLLTRVKERGASIQRAEHESTWRLSLSDGWAGFMAGMSNTQRAQTRNLLNRFDKRGDWTFRTVDGIGVNNGLGSFIDLHQRRWGADGEEGCFADSRFERFVRGAAERLSLRNKVEIMMLEQAGTLVGAMLCLRDERGNMYVYQAGRDPQLSHARVGQMLHLLAIRTACQRGVQFIDYLRGDEIYKRRLGASPTPCNRLRLFAPTFNAQLPYHALLLSKFARDGLGSLIGTSRSGIFKVMRSLLDSAE